MELRHLRVLAAVVDHGGYTRAARALGVAQSTVSECVAALERALGVPVFARRGRTAALTPAGEALLPHARRILAAADEALAEVARAERGVRATVTVGANESVGSYLLPGPLAALRDRWPGAAFRVETALCAAIREGVRTGRLDLGLVLEPADGADAVGETALVVFAAPGHPLAGAAAPADALARRRWLLTEAAGSHHAMLGRWFEAAGHALPPVEAVGTVEGVRRGVLSRPDALGLLPAFVVADDLAAGRAAAVHPSPALPPLSLKTVVLPGRAPSPMAADLLAELERVLERNGA